MSDLAAVATELESEARRLLDLAAQVRQCEADAREEPRPAQPVRLLQAREAAQLLGVSQKRLYDISAQDGGPPHVRLGERSMRWPLRALQEWLGERSGGS